MRQMVMDQDSQNTYIDFQQQPKEASFERFIKITEMKRYRKLLEKRLQHQLAKERKDRTLEKIKIIPPQLKQGWKDYNPQQSQQTVIRKISLHFPSYFRRSEQEISQLPKLQQKISSASASHEFKWSHNFRKDEVNALQQNSQRLRSKTFDQIAPIVKIRLQRSNRVSTHKSFT